MDLGGPEILIIIVIVVLLFGSSQLPKLARSIGQAQKEFKHGLKEGESGKTADDDASADEKSTADETSADDTK